MSILIDLRCICLILENGNYWSLALGKTKEFNSRSGHRTFVPKVIYSPFSPKIKRLILIRSPFVPNLPT